MKCAKDSLVAVGILLTVVSLVTGVIMTQVNKAGAEIDDIRAENKQDIKDLESRLEKRLDTMDAKLDQIIYHQLNHSP